MPGGSINGRPFRESNDSYQKSGVPCGNPKRFQSKEVVRMGDAGFSKGPARRPLSGPVEEIETEGQRQLQQLLNRQLDTNVTFHQQISQRRQFHKSSAFLPETERLSGVTDLCKFKDIERRDEHTAELKHCGLTEDEIRYKLKHDSTSIMAARKRKYGEDPSCNIDKMDEIEQKIKQRQKRLNHPDTFFGRKNLTRHEMELEQSLIQDNVKSKLLTGMLTTIQRDPTIHPDDPMNNLPEILNSVTKVNKEGKRERRKNKQKMTEDSPESAENEQQDTRMSDRPELCDRDSLDQQDTDICDRPELCDRDSLDQQDTDICDRPELCDRDSLDQQDTDICDRPSCMTKNESEVLNTMEFSDNKFKRSDLHKNLQDQFVVTENSPTQIKEIVQVNDNRKCTKNIECTSREIQGQVILVSEEDIIKNRLTLEEIKKLPRFENFSVGDPSNVLYLKNLSPKTTEEDLVSLFIRFEKQNAPKIIFRLMTGRMKGQAFVTFVDSSVAQKALELINGYNLKGKPLIIMFGRKAS